MMASTESTLVFRFVRAVAELELLGIVAPSKKGYVDKLFFVPL